MASSFSYKQRECETCGGPLNFDKANNEYVCTYCGNHYERQEEYDGVYEIRHTATETLSSLVDRDMDQADAGLVKCRSIDPTYPGSIVAQLALHVIAASRALDQNEKRNGLSQAVEAYHKLPSPFDPQTADVEADFYDGIESADIRSLLITVFRTFKDTARVDYLSRSFDVENIHSEKAANSLITQAFSSGDYAKVDALLKSPAGLDADRLYALVLNQYPDTPQKVENVSTTIGRGVSPADGRDALSSYLTQTQDAPATRLAIAERSTARGIVPNGQAIAALITSAPDESSVLGLLGALGGDKLNDNDLAATVQVLLTGTDAPVAIKGLNALANAGYYLEFSQQALLDMLTRTDLSAELRLSVFNAARAIGINDRRVQSVFSGFVSARMPVDDKFAVMEGLLAAIPSLNPMSVEEYLMNSTMDGEAKPKVLRLMLDHLQARESLRMAVRRYPAATQDAPQVRDRIVSILIQERLLDPSVVR